MTFFFTASVALFTSTLGIIVRDTQMIMQALLRILFYMSPILWVPKDSGIGGTIGEIIKFNPVYFLVNHIVRDFIPRMVLYRTLEIIII